MDPKKIGISEDLKYRYLGDTGISKNRAARHPSGGPAGHARAFETREKLSVDTKGLGKQGVAAFSRLGVLEVCLWACVNRVYFVVLMLHGFNIVLARKLYVQGLGFGFKAQGSRV
jgi:hypothetical protein